MKNRHAAVFQWYRSRVHSDIARFQRYLVRVERMMRSGSFCELARETRRAIQEMLEQMYRRLSELQRQAALGLATGLMVFGLLAVPMHAELTFEEQTGSASPFQSIAHSGFDLHPTLADIDGMGTWT